MYQLDWIKVHYNDLIKSFGGKWVIIKDNKVIFSHDKFNIVFDHYKMIKNKEKCEIVFIETGDAAFYAFKI